jgi:hypothetical protein
MKIRELLQTEIWNRRTTRKILVGFGIVFGVAAIGLGILYAVEVNWLTAGERNAAKAALTQIDALQDAGPLSDAEFKVRQEQTDAKVKAAQDAAETLKDDSTQETLFWYLAAVELERSKVQFKGQTESWSRMAGFAGRSGTRKAKRKLMLL